MTDITKLDLEKSQPKFISVGSNVFVSSTGKSEVCRKGQQGLFCRRHHGSSYSSQPEVRAMLDKHANRTIEKLSPFENGCIWLYSVLMRTSMEEARKHYIESTAMYTLLGVRKPSDIEVKGLQKALMGLIESSKIQDTRMDKLKKLVKDMAFGKGFTEAGFYTLKDMTKETLNKIKLGFAGLTLGSSLLLTGCAGVQNPLQPDPVRTVQQAEIDTAKVTDDLGAYLRDTSATAPSVKWQELGDGVSKEASSEIKPWITNFVLTEVLDSIALDNPSKWEEWKNTVAPKYISSKYIDEILNSEGYIILADGKDTSRDLVPTLFRDGKSRVSSKKITSANIAVDPNNKNLYYVTISGNMEAKVSDEEYMNWDLANTSGVTESYKELYRNDTSVPPFNDPEPEGFGVDYTLSFSVVKEGNSWKIVGFSNSFGTQRITY